MICLSHTVYSRQSSPLTAAIDNVLRMSRKKNKKPFHSTLMVKSAHGADPCAVSVTTMLGTLGKKAWREQLPRWGVDQHVSSRGKRRQPHPRHTGKRGKKHQETAGQTNFSQIMCGKRLRSPDIVRFCSFFIISNVFLVDHLDSVRAI